MIALSCDKKISLVVLRISHKARMWRTDGRTELRLPRLR